MDEAKLGKILERIGWVAEPSVGGRAPDLPYPVLSLEEFFEGNDDGSSIVCNLESSPEPSEVFDFLKTIRSRPDVADVLIMVTQWDGPGSWPFSDTVWFLTTANAETVSNWIPQEYRPDEIWTGLPDHYLVEPIKIPKDYKLVGAWYD